jgi:glycosyltransferase involved in cell wall biosynthesis
VLLPTRDRLELLRSAIHSVLCQDYDDWEVIVSDNFSEQDIATYVKSLNEPRIKYFRTRSSVPVTENWNNALAKSCGDYVIMLGDDDCLMKGYFTAMCHLFEQFTSPDFVYTSGFIYAYPRVLPDCPEGFLRAYPNAAFLRLKQKPFWLPRDEALRLVQQAMDFRVLFAYNMQYACISRRIIRRLQSKGDFFQSPYPDYYAMTTLMLNADRILACPYRLVTIGISPKSFGFYYFNRREEEGLKFLNNLSAGQVEQRIRKMFLPGTNMNTSWLLSMELVKTNYEDDFPLTVNYDRYRLLQIFQVYKDWLTKQSFADTEMAQLWRLMSFKEKMIYGAPFHIAFGFGLLCRRAFLTRIVTTLARPVFYRLERLINPHPDWSSQLVEGEFQSIKEVFDQVNPADYQQNQLPTL